MNIPLGPKWLKLYIIWTLNSIKCAFNKALHYKNKTGLFYYYYY